MKGEKEDTVSTSILETPVIDLVRDFLRENALALNPCADQLKITPDQESLVLQTFFPSEKAFSNALATLSASVGNEEANIVMYLLHQHGADTERMQSQISTLIDGLVLPKVRVELAINVQFDLKKGSIDSVRKQFAMLPDILINYCVVDLDKSAFAYTVSPVAQLPDNDSINGWIRGLIIEDNLSSEKIIDRLVSFGNMSPLNFAMTANHEMMKKGMLQAVSSKQNTCEAELLFSMQIAPEGKSLGELREIFSEILPYLSDNKLLSGNTSSKVISQKASVLLRGVSDAYNSDHNHMVEHISALFDKGDLFKGSNFTEVYAAHLMVKFGRMTPQAFFHLMHS